jgi:hypothetical protein
MLYRQKFDTFISTEVPVRQDAPGPESGFKAKWYKNMQVHVSFSFKSISSIAKRKS